MPISKNYVQFPGSATVGEVLQAFLDRNADWWWLLTTEDEKEGKHYVCSFGSLLPYLTGRTPHIVHNIGDCPICSGIDPLLWSDTGTLVEEALADGAICSRLVSDLPMAELPIIDTSTIDDPQARPWPMAGPGRVWGVTENGVLCGMYIIQVKGDLGGMPAF